MTDAGSAPSALVVDDDESVASLISDQLTEQGYSVTTVADGREALDLIRRQSFDLVVCDIQLPTVDGLTVLFLAKKEKPTLPFVMVSALENLPTIGGVPFVKKPIHTEKLLDAIGVALERSKRR